MFLESFNGTSFSFIIAKLNLKNLGFVLFHNSSHNGIVNILTTARIIYWADLAYSPSSKFWSGDGYLDSGQMGLGVVTLKLG